MPSLAPPFSMPDAFYFSGASITVLVNAVPFPASSTNAKQSIDRKEVRLHGQEIAGRTSGFISRSGSVELVKEWGDRLVALLASQFGGWANGAFNICIKVAEERNPANIKVSQVDMIGCFIKSWEDTYNVESSDALKTKFELDVNQILINGISATGQVGVDAVSV